jgi:hypothetical protein
MRFPSLRLIVGRIGTNQAVHPLDLVAAAEDRVGVG